MTHRYWLIRGYNGNEKIFETKARYSYFSENQVKCLLKAMASKLGLDLNQMVGAFAGKQCRISNTLLAVRSDANKGMLICGQDPYFTATIVVDEES